MSEQKKKDDLADALAAFAAGHHDEEPHADEHHDGHHEEGGAHEAVYAEPPAPVAPPRPAPPRPAAPPAADQFIQNEAAPQEELVGGIEGGVESSGGAWVGDAPVDDDAMLAPAPDAAMLAHKPSRVVKRDPMLASLGFKQTLIPILL